MLDAEGAGRGRAAEAALRRRCCARAQKTTTSVRKHGRGTERQTLADAGVGSTERKQSRAPRGLAEAVDAANGGQ